MGLPNSYNPRNLESLFGYGRAAQVRSGGVCQLCGCGKSRDIDFDLWRQFTIEHLIGQGDGGYPHRIRAAVFRQVRYPPHELLRRPPGDRTAHSCGPLWSPCARRRWGALTRSDDTCVAAGAGLCSPVCAGRDSYHLARGPVSVNRRPFPTDANRPNITSEALRRF
jgi:hypothetical protein